MKWNLLGVLFLCSALLAGAGVAAAGGWFFLLSPKQDALEKAARESSERSAKLQNTDKAVADALAKKIEAERERDSAQGKLGELRSQFDDAKSELKQAQSALESAKKERDLAKQRASDDG